MIILQIEFPVLNYDDWKKMFENDPLKRVESGVKSYRISRLADNQNYVLVELEFADHSAAQSMLKRLEELWGAVEDKVMSMAKGRIIEVIETKKY